MLQPGHSIFRLSNLRALQAFQVMRQGSAILTAILLAKSALPTDQIGVYEQLQYLQYAVSFFWVSGLIQGMLSSYPKATHEEQAGFIFSAYTAFILLSIAFSVALFAGQRPALVLLTGKDSLDYFQLFLIYLLLNLPTYLLEHFYLLLERPGRILAFGLFSFAGHLAVVIIPVFAGMDFRFSFFGLILLALLKHLWLAWAVARNGQVKWPGALERNWFLLSAPLIAYALLGGFIQTFSSWWVNFWFQGDDTQFAVFRYGAREFPLAVALTDAFSAAMIPEIGKNLENGLSMIRQRSQRLMHWLFPVSILMVLTSKWFFPVVFSSEFTDSIPVFNAFLLIVISRLVFPRTVLVALQDNRAVLGISALELLLHVLLSVLLIRFWGISGVAMATVLAYFFEKALQVWRLYRQFGIGPEAYIDLKWWLGYTLTLLIAYFWVSAPIFF